MLLEKKNAIIYGGGGALGGGIARAFAREGATVFLAGRTRDTLDQVAADIAAAGGSAEVAVLDPRRAGRGRTRPGRGGPGGQPRRVAQPGQPGRRAGRPAGRDVGGRLPPA